MSARSTTSGCCWPCPPSPRRSGRPSRSTTTPLADGEIDFLIGGGLPTLIWQVDAIDLGAPHGVACDHVWSIESLLAEGQPGGPIAIVTCEREQGPAYRVPVDPATTAELRAALGLPLAP